MNTEKEITRAIVDSICKSINENATVLDIGFGNTVLLENVIASKNIKSYTGIDVNKIVIKEATEILSRWQNKCNISFICGTIDQLSLPRVDTIICSRIFHHLPIQTARQYIDLLVDTLSDGGRLIVVDSIRDFSNRSNHYSYPPIFYINELSRTWRNDAHIVYSPVDCIDVNQFWKLVISLHSKCFSFEISTIGG